MIRPTLLLASALPLVLIPAACEKQEATAPAPSVTKPMPQLVPPAPVAEVKASAEAPSAPALPPGTYDVSKLPTTVDIGAFGSEEPVEREDLPSRGVITFDESAVKHQSMQHWEQYEWSNFKAKRWGRYQVRLTYSMISGSLGMQFRIGDLIVKRPLATAPRPRATYLGEVYIAQPGDLPFSMITAAASAGTNLKIHEVALIPTSEGEDVVQAAPDGSITLLAKDATTWSENMRYEPKPEKNCLGFWTDPADFAEWAFHVSKPGRYKVSVVQGCGTGNGGSEVEVKLAGQTLKFKVEETGGFQNWKEVTAGEVEIQQNGKFEPHRLQIDPVNKTKNAVLDVQKVVLTPLG